MPSDYVTGDCAYSTIECPEGQILGCHTPVVDDDGFPLGPPRITECLKSEYSYPLKSIDTPNGLFTMTSSSVQLRSYTDFNTITWSSTKISTIEKIVGIQYIESLDVYAYSGYATYVNSYGTRGLEVVILNSDGSLNKTFKLDDTWGVNNHDYSGCDIYYNNGGIYASGLFQHSTLLDNCRAGYAEWNFTSETLTKVYGSMEIRGDSLIPVSIATIEGSTNMYIGIGMYRYTSPSVYYGRGRLYVHTLGSDTSTLVKEGTRVTSTGQYEWYASKLHIFQDKLIVASGAEYSNSNGFNQNGIYGKASDRVDIVNFNSSVIENTIITEYPNTVDLTTTLSEYGNHFGNNIGIYGNFILFGCSGENSGFGASYLYDKDFNLLQRLQPKPLATSNDAWGIFVAINNSNILFGTKDLTYADYHMNCTYTNFGV